MYREKKEGENRVLFSLIVDRCCPPSLPTTTISLDVDQTKTREKKRSKK